MGNQTSSSLALIEKAGEGDAKTVQTLLADPGMDVNACGEDERTALFMAAMRGHTKVVQLLLDYLPDVETDTDEQKTEKINRRADTNRSDLENLSPLYAAAFGGHADVVKLLLADQKERRFDFRANQADHKEQTPLFVASEQGHKDVVDLLIQDERVSIDATNSSGLDAFAIVTEKLMEREPLLTAGADKHEFDENERYNVGDVVTNDHGADVVVRFSLLKIGKRWDSSKKRAVYWVPRPPHSEYWERCDVESHRNISFMLQEALKKHHGSQVAEDDEDGKEGSEEEDGDENGEENGEENDAEVVEPEEEEEEKGGEESTKGE